MKTIRYHIQQNSTACSFRLLLLLLLMTMSPIYVLADDEPRISIGGSVYGGGRQGAIVENKEKKNADGSRVLDANGDPVIEIAGGADAGKTNVTIYEGVIGSDEALAEGNGNVFGGGFGPAANVMHTTVTIYDGIIWNSIHGGGEIAAVGKGFMDPPIDKVPILNHVEKQGTTTVMMYGGHVKRNVFGGGRGYSYASDDGSYSQTRLYTDGYVFGHTIVRIYGGMVGTPEGVADGYGNVFGGGDVGFLYSGNERKVVGEGVAGIKDVNFLENGKTYYVIPDDNYLQSKGLTAKQRASYFANPDDALPANRGDLSIACDVLVEPMCKVKENQTITLNNTTYNEGEYVKTEDLNYLNYKDTPESSANTDWNKLEDDGIIIYNAVFAGGNVSTGDDKVYAETTTVYGNVSATVKDLYYRDLVTIGTEHVGGLYGDGNLTFADGYRELSLSSYGTDYYNLKEEVDATVYEEMLPREQAYYQMKYRCIAAYGSYQVGDIIAEGVWSLMSDEDKARWEKAGFRSKYAGRLLNTIQRADFAGVFGSRLVLQGAMDRVLTKEGDELKFEDYTLNRIGELSLNKQRAPGVTDENTTNLYGNYFGIYNQVNYLGALTSDVRFYEDNVWIANETTGVREDKGSTYADWKTDNFADSRKKNVGNSENLIALASGVALELKQEPTSTTQGHWGVITGVIQLDLINVTQGEGGGFVYARNEHGLMSRYQVEGRPYVRKFLSDNNRTGEAATHEEYTYNENDLDDMQTSGNFVLSPREDQYIVDDCYPIHGKNIGGNMYPTEAHYWYIRGSKYVYNQHISVYTGAAKKYQVSKGIELATGVRNGKLILKDVYPGYYCNIAEDANPIYVDDVEYKRGDPMTWWDYQKLVEAGDVNAAYFDEDTTEFGQSLNNMSHDNGFVLTLEFDNDELSFWKPITLVPSPDDPSTTEYGPSFTPSVSGAYGQHVYQKGQYIPEAERNDYVNNQVGVGLTGQAVVSEEPLEGYQLCLESLQLTSGGSLLLTKGELVKDDEIDGLMRKYMAIKSEIPENQVDPDTNPYKDEAYQEINKRLTECYKVLEEGKYGGALYTAGQTYNALDGWGLLVSTDRAKWQFRNDALDLLNVIDKYKYSNADNIPSVDLETSPQAVMSLYMSRDSRLLNLSKDKNLTVHFEYSYDEGEGSESTHYTEQHYINITIEFKDELPDVGKLEEPDIVLPGTKISFKQPTVVAGAYNIAGGGWEIYKSEEDAVGHINGTPFINRDTPFHWYQDGFWVNYYAQTMVGRQYSEKPVQVKVANYHDLRRVVEDSESYLGIGMRKVYPDDYPVGTPNTDQQRSPKVYINDYSEDDKSGLDMLKTLFDLTYSDEKLSSTVSGCQDLEIILRSDLSPNVADSWSASIGTGDQCFGGNLHGDGYTISGVNASLFNKVCGNIYNLGVTGSFTGSGIADTNSGHIENCWVQNEGSPDGSTKPVGNGGTIVNSYYNKGKYSATTTGAIAKDANAFYNGSVAYELNGFFMKKNSKTSEGDLTNLTANYVENRYRDGDYRYAEGIIPDEEDEDRYHFLKEDANNPEKITSEWWEPLADDYIFFGQTLNYGYVEGVDHEDKPSRIADDLANRVYRAPAYFQNAIPSKAYYNTNAVFAAKSADNLHDVYSGMTAIDFTGNGATSSIVDHPTKLADFMNANLTPNLLVYAADADKALFTRYLDNKEPVFAFRTASTGIGAKSVAIVSEDDIDRIKGHAVYKAASGTGYQAAKDHFLVDGHDYFAPITYKAGSRIWYQRRPDNYVEKSTGWETVSLPFTADIVTTQTKGEITHFYKTDGENYGDQSKGHEYWLREYQGTGANDELDDNIFVATFSYPAAITDEGASTKVVTNTFLWDYYYSKENQPGDAGSDVNTDDYQQYYKNADRRYMGYPYLSANKPYLIGFPGERYYEFDMSGRFMAEHTDRHPAILDAQTVTFVSAENADVPVTDESPVTGSDYDFVPCFIKKDAGTKVYMLNQHVSEEDDPAGSIFEQVTSTDQTIPFRAYFTANSNASPSRGVMFADGDMTDMSTNLEIVDSQIADADSGLVIKAGEHSIVVKSNLNESTAVRIVNISGITLSSFTIAPGETVVTPVHLGGIYIVNHKKIIVK